MENLCKKIVENLIEQNISISFMESCTGGFLANQITNIDNSSKVFKVGIVSYSNEYKIKFNVSEKIINRYSVYSIEVAKEMSKAISDLSNAEFGIGISGEIGKNSSNIVYYSIFIKSTNSYITKKIAVQENSRNEKKSFIAKKIFSEILEILLKNKKG